MRTTCHSVGRPPISTRALGIAWVCSWRRVPRPPQRIATGSMPSTEGSVWNSPRPAGLAAGDGGQDGHLVAVLKRCVETVLEADVLAGHVHVDEPPQATVLGDPFPQVVVLAEERVHGLPPRGPVALALALAVRHTSKLCGDLHGDRHGARTLSGEGRLQTALKRLESGLDLVHPEALAGRVERLEPLA